MPCRCVCAVCDTCIASVDKCIYCRNAPPLPYLRLSQHTANHIDMLMGRMELMSAQLQHYRQQVHARTKIKRMTVVLAFLAGMLVYQTLLQTNPTFRRTVLEPLLPLLYDKEHLCDDCHRVRQVPFELFYDIDEKHV